MMTEAEKLRKIACEVLAKSRELEKRFDAVEHSAAIKQLEADKRELEIKLAVAQSSISFWQRFAETLQRKLCASDVEVAMVYGGVLKRDVCEASDVEITTIITEEITVRCDDATQE